MTRLVWLRDDLRLDDQPAIRAAASEPALFVFVYDERLATRPLGAACRWWLNKSLSAFAADLAKHGGRLDILVGDAQTLIPALARHVSAVYWTHRYGLQEREAEARIEISLQAMGVKTQSFGGRLLREPHEVTKTTGEAFKVFTPFWRHLQSLGPFPAPVPAPQRLHTAPWPQDAPERVTIDGLALHPQKPDWSHGLSQTWIPGEAGAFARLRRFAEQALPDYAAARDQLAGDTTSLLSPHLRFGEISPRRIAAEILQARHTDRNVQKFLAELGWREFSYTLLTQAPHLHSHNWNPRFNNFPWHQDVRALKAWQRGRTGYPIVDAAMRELWATGFMHNRGRLIVGSFLTKHLRIDWRAGEAWFWDTLCDADEASNPANWQWIAGCGADAAPYFRVFNPLLQGEKFDPQGHYVRRWVPELARLSVRYIHAPWQAPPLALQEAGVRLGRDYPTPIVDHTQAREAALAAFSTLS